MDRVKIKNEAKERIKGNKWYIWKPAVIFGLILGAITGVLTGIFGAIGGDTGKILVLIVSIISGIIEIAFNIGYVHYILEFVRGNRMEWQDAVTYAKEHFAKAILLSLVVGILVIIGSALLFIPGMIIAIGLNFYQEVLVDNPDLSLIDLLKKSWNLTNGHKIDIFIFMLSFLGWIIASGFTIGILLIWVIPYITVALMIVYEELRKAA